MKEILAGIKQELLLLFAAHKQVGLEGYMCFYTRPDQDVWRAEQPGQQLWFGPNEIDAALAQLQTLYNNGKLPNSPLLLNPIIHQTDPNTSQPVPKGSGFAWCLAPCLGIAGYDPTAADRLAVIGALTAKLKRGDNIQAGLKAIAFSDRILAPTEDGAVEGCRELYDVTDIQSAEFAPFYLLSGLEYLSKNGSFSHPDLHALLKSGKASPTETPENIVRANRISPQRILDASICWNQYDRHHVLFRRFGIDVAGLKENLKYYNLCGRDFELLDASGAQHAQADTSVNFDFLVEGWIPKGAVTIIGATGGTGKSSLAHNLAVKCAIDYRPEEEKPTWLGSRINFDKAQGMCIYFSGEDGPAIVHTRAKVYDPEGRANRLMFQRTDFGEGVSFDQFMKKLMKLPDVPLLVIDPARKYLTGDENDAGVVSAFFEAIEEFAIRKNAATVVVHHLVKGAAPKHVREIYDMLRGSQVFIDRARVVIGMYREGPYTVAGLAKNNIPPQMGMIQGERLYVRDPDALELRLLPGPEGIRNDELTEEALEELMNEKGVKPGPAPAKAPISAPPPPAITPPAQKTPPTPAAPTAAPQTAVPTPAPPPAQKIPPTPAAPTPPPTAVTPRSISRIAARRARITGQATPAPATPAAPTPAPSPQPRALPFPPAPISKPAQTTPPTAAPRPTPPAAKAATPAPARPATTQAPPRPPNKPMA